MTPARFVKCCRQHLALSQRDLAAELNSSASSIRGWEQGSQLPPLKHLCRLAELIGSPIRVTAGPDGPVIANGPEIIVALAAAAATA